MRPATTTFLASLRHSHSTATRCDLIFPEAPTQPVSVPIEQGTVTIDRTAQNRRTGTVRIPWSLEAGATLDLDLRTLPLGGYAILHRGLRYGDGTLELIKLGVLRVESVSWETLAASANLTLTDRMTQVREEPFTAPYAAGGKTAWQAATEIVYAVFGGSIQYLTPYQPTTLLVDVFYTGSRADALTALEEASDAEAYFNADGDFVFDHKPAGGVPVWIVDANPTGVMTDASENLDRTGIYNGVLVQGQADAATPPFSALATFDDPTSPVRWGGPFGKVALIVNSTSVTNQADAATVAQNMLHLRLKQTRSLTLKAAPNPALEAGDTIGVEFPDGRIEQHLIDAVRVSLGTDDQEIQTRSQFTPSQQDRQVPLPTTDRMFYGRQAWQELRVA